MKNIYFDNAATTQVNVAVIEKMNLAMHEVYGNPASVHVFGQKAQQLLDESREVVARYFGVDFSQIIFTSGATEANSLLINHFLGSKIRISDIEHSSLQKVPKRFADGGEDIVLVPFAEVSSFSDQTDLLSAMRVNNETGIVLDLPQGKDDSKKYFHSDMVQAMYVDSDSLNFDFITATAHKLHGPKGVGVLITPEDFKLEPLFTGGGQESNMRPGTVNIPAVVGFAEALKIHTDGREKTIEHISNISSVFKMHIQQAGAELLESRFADFAFSPHIASVIFESNAEELMQFLSMKGIAVSKGSACSSGSTERSHVLQAMGLSDDEIDSVLRFSFSKFSTEEEVKHVVDVIAQFSRL